MAATAPTKKENEETKKGGGISWLLHQDEKSGFGGASFRMPNDPSNCNAPLGRVSSHPRCKAQDLAMLNSELQAAKAELDADKDLPAAFRRAIADVPNWSADDMSLALGQFSLRPTFRDIVLPSSLLRRPRAFRHLTCDAPVLPVRLGGDGPLPDDQKEPTSCSLLRRNQDKSTITLRVSNLLTLLPTRWLDSVVIDAYVHAVVELSPYKNRIYVLSAQADPLFSEIKNTPACYRYILAPLFRNSHWTVLFVDHGENRGSPNNRGRVRHLNSQIVNPKTPVVQTRPWCECFPEYEVNDLQKAYRELPQQDNMYDCGVWVCFWTMAFLFFTDKELDSVDEPTVAAFRTQVLRQLLQHYVLLPPSVMYAVAKSQAKRVDQVDE
jgi:hypothetical protein